MRRRPWGLYAIALATVIIGLVYLGVSASTLVIGALVLACPVAMIFMMRAMHDETAPTMTPMATRMSMEGTATAARHTCDRDREDGVHRSQDAGLTREPARLAAESAIAPGTGAMARR